MRKIFKNKKLVEPVITFCLILIIILLVHSGIVTAAEIMQEKEEQEEKIEINVEQDIEKYLNINDKQMLLQQKIAITENVKDIVKEREILQIKVPLIENKKPETAILLINGQKIGNEYYKYNQNEGNIDIQYFENKNNIYKIIYLYEGQTTKQTITLNTKVYSKYENIEEIQTEDNKQIDLIEKGNEISILEDMTKEVYKGYLYEARENITPYKENYAIEISNIPEIEAIDISNEKEAFTYYIQDEKIEFQNDSSYFIRTSIKKDEFLRILGENGKITINDGEKETIITKDSQEDENGNVIIEYGENIKDINISTTKPVELGTLTIYNEKAIGAKTGYTKEELKKFEYLESNIKLNEETFNSKMELLDTKPEAKIEISNNNLSTLTLNPNIQITVTLLSNSNKYDLYKNPVVDIILPKGMSINVENAKQISSDEEIKIKTIEQGIDNEGRQTIRITLEGEQTKYISNLNDGIQLAIIGNINLPNTTPSQEATIEVLYTNDNRKNEQFETQSIVQINSKYGVLMASKLENYNSEQEKVETLDDEEAKVILDTMSQEKMATKTVEIINNYENSISEISIIGNLSEDSKGIKIQDIKGIENKNYKIYYSENKETNKESNNWKENLEELEEIKSFKIEIEDEIQPKETTTISYKLNIPANLEANSALENQSILEYNYLGNIEETVSNFTLETENQKKSEISLTDDEDENKTLDVLIEALSGEEKLKDGDTVKEGQGIRYNISLTNNTKNTMSNVSIEATNENAIYYNTIEYEDEINGETYVLHKIDEDPELKSKIIEIGTINVGETKNVSYQISVGKVDDNDQNLTGKIKITADDFEEKTIDNIQNKIQNSDIKASLRSELVEDITVYTYGGYPISMEVENLSENELNNVTIELPTVEGLTLSTDQFAIVQENKYEFVEYENGVAKFKIPKIEANEKIKLIVKLIVDPMDISILEKTFSEYFKVIYNDNTYISNDIQKTIYQLETKITVNQTTNIKGDTVKDGDNIKFIFDIKNEGTIEKDIGIMDKISDGLKINYAKIKTDKEEKQLDASISLLTANITMQPNETAKLEIDTTLQKDLAIESKISNYAEISGMRVNLTSNKIEFKIEGNEYLDDNNNQDDDNNQDNDNNQDDNNDQNDDNNGDNNEENNVNSSKYSISGTAWVDSNENGLKEISESKISNMAVMLIDEETGKIAKNKESAELTTKTGENGEYSFNNLEKGKYIVVFQYDTGKYTVTTYQKNGVSQKANSDVIYSVMNINNQEIKLAKTETLEINNENLENIDAGFIKGKEFDLKLDKSIKQITVQNNSGTKIYSFNNKEKLAKIEIEAKYLSNSNIIIEYNIGVTNQGDVAGYASEIVDYIPEDLVFNTGLNKNWYQNTDGNIYTKELSNQIINPGETKDITLILTKKMTPENTGTITNKAEIGKSGNDYIIKEANNVNNTSQAEVIVSVKTGAIVIYTTLIAITVMIIATGVYLIKRKVLTK